MPSWFLYLFDASIAIAAILGFLFFMRHKYASEVGPSKKYPSGKMICEFWPKAGLDYTLILPKEPDDTTIRVEHIKDLKGISEVIRNTHTVTEYKYSRSSVRQVMYPSNPFLGLKWVQVRAEKVVWVENNPDPIDPFVVKPFVDADMFFYTRDKDFLAFATAAEQEIRELEERLQEALTKGANKLYVYIGLIAATAGSVAAAILVYQVLQKLTINGF